LFVGNITYIEGGYMRYLTPFFTAKNNTADLFGEMDRFFENLNETPQLFDEKGFSPVCEVIETDSDYKLSFDLPGLKKDEIKIEMKDNVLSVFGERKREKTEKKEKVQRYERSYGYFRRSFSLPTSVVAEKIAAKYDNGVLELTVPKAELAKPKTIEVQ